MRRNIAIIYISNFLTGLVFWYGVEKLFMQKIGIDAFGIGVNAVVLMVVNMLLDVPMGVLADRWSRKYTLVLAMVALGASSWLLGASHDLPMYLVGTVIYGLYLCMTNGTFQAITYDTLYENGQQASYAKHQATAYGLFMCGVAVSSFAGGFMAQHFGYPSTYYWSAALCIPNILLLLTLHEPKFAKLKVGTGVLQHIGEASRLLKSTNTLLFLSSVIVMITLLRSTLNEFAGLYFIAIGFGAIGSGAAGSGKWVFGAIGQFISSRVAKLLPLWTVLFFVAFAVMSTWRSTLGLIFFFTATFTYSIIQNESHAMLQHELPSGLRATALSVLNFLSNTMLVPLGLAFGWIAREYDVFRAYQMFAALGLLYLLVWTFWRRSVHLPQPAEVVSPEQPMI